MKVLRTIMCESADFEHAVILGYNPDPRFLDRVLVPSLRRQGTRNIIVAADPGAIAESLAGGGGGLVGLGRSWLLWPVSAPVRFHPKLIVQAGQTRVRIWIGSGNPTHPGLSRNAEVWSVFDWAQGSAPTPTMQSAMTYVLDRLRRSAVTAARRHALLEFEDCADVLSLAESTPDGSDDLLCLPSSSGASLLAQMAARVGHAVETITIVAPYYDAQLRALSRIRSRWSSARVRLWVDPRMGNLDVRQVPAGVEVAGVRLANRESARVHAKVYVFEGTHERTAFTGSANCSAAALLHDGEARGNAELLVQIAHFDEAFLDALATAPITEAEAVAMRERLEASPPVVSTTCELTGAERAGKQLKLMTNDDLTGALVEVRSSSDERTASLSVQQRGEIWQTEDLPDDMTRGCAFARVEGGQRWVVLDDPRLLAIARSEHGGAGAVEQLFCDQVLSKESIRALFAYIEALRAPTPSRTARGGGASSTSSADTTLRARSAVASESASPEEDDVVQALERAVEQSRLDSAFRWVARGWREGGQGPEAEDDAPEETDDQTDEDEDDTEDEASHAQPPLPPELAESTWIRLDRLLDRAVAWRVNDGTEGLRRLREALVLVGFTFFLHENRVVHHLPGRLIELFDGIEWSLVADSEPSAEGMTRAGLLHLIVFIAWRLSTHGPTKRDPLEGGTYRVLRVIAPELESLRISRGELSRLRKGPIGGQYRIPDATLDDIEAFFRDAVEFACELTRFEGMLVERWGELLKKHPVSQESDLIAVQRGGRIDYGFVQSHKGRRFELDWYLRVGQSSKTVTCGLQQVSQVIDLEAAADDLPAFSELIERLVQLH